MAHYTSLKAKRSVFFLIQAYKVICKHLALYFDLWSKLYYICFNFHYKWKYHLPTGKYSCGVAINPYRYATNACFILLIGKYPRRPDNL